MRVSLASALVAAIACTSSRPGSGTPSPQGRAGAPISEAGTRSDPPSAGRAAASGGGAPAAGSGNASGGHAAGGRGVQPAAGADAGAAAGSGAAAGNGADEDAGVGTPNPNPALRWWLTCGHPVCQVGNDPFDVPNIPNCRDQKLGDPCVQLGEQCDGVATCGAKWVCAASDPKLQPCPMSRARFKEQIEYLDAAQRRSYRDQLLRMPLASYRYRYAPEAGPQLGFMIDDVEPSVAASGDHVNLYGYLSMAVAAIQEQQQQIEALQREVEQLRATGSSTAQPAMCEP